MRPWKSWVTRLQIIQFVSSMAAFVPAMYYMWERSACLLTWSA